MTYAPPFDLTGRIAIVTGGNGGLGLGMALGLARAGASIVIAARQAAKADLALAAIATTGASACFLETDVAERDACFAMAEETVRRFGRIDILIANAGIAAGGRAAEMPEADWRRTLDVNLSGSFFSAQAVHPHMKAAGGGKIVTIRSMMSIFGAAGAPDYGASKGAVVQLTRALAVEWERDNIQVNAILPGWLTSEMGDRARGRPGFEESVVRRPPARRWGSPTTSPASPCSCRRPPRIS